MTTKVLLNGKIKRLQKNSLMINKFNNGEYVQALDKNQSLIKLR